MSLPTSFRYSWKSAISKSWFLWVPFTGIICLGSLWGAVETAAQGRSLEGGALTDRGLPEPEERERSRPLADLVPREVLGWKAVESDRLYKGEEIFDYMDGAGELYRSYGFHRLLVRRLEKTDSPPITVELYDMGSSRDAFGVFSLQRIDPEAHVGQGSELGGGLLRFWQDTYFAQVYAEGESPDAREVILLLGRRTADTVGRSGPEPEILALLPEEGLDRGNASYFHNHVCLNYRYFLASENILGLGEDTEAVLARYGGPDEETRLLLVRYPDETRAEAARAGFVASYLPEGAETGLAPTENGAWTAVRSEGPHLAVVFDAPSEEAAKSLLARVESRLEEARS